MEKKSTFLEEDTPLSFPKIIHQTYISRESIPEHWKESEKKWQEYHSSENVKESERGEYKFWSDEDNLNFVKDYFPDFLETFQGYKYAIQRADAIRYMILYVYGGIYSDLDIVPKTNIFEHFSSGDIFLVHSANNNLNLTNSFMASRPRQKFWLEVIDEMKKCKDSYNYGKNFKVMCTTGPLMLNRVAKKTESNITILSRFLFNSTSVVEIENGKDTEKSLLKNIKGSSWHSLDSTILGFFNNLRYIFIGMAITLAIFVLIFSIKILMSYTYIKNNCDVVCPIKNKNV